MPKESKCASCGEGHIAGNDNFEKGNKIKGN